VAEDTLKFISGQIVAGKYRIEKQIGAGGMGVVAVATHVALGQRVAIKFLNDEAMKDADVMARFDREARASVQLKSEHVARVLDVGTLENGAPYMVMEFLEGQDLSKLVDARVAVPPPVAVDYIMQACEAIAEAHRLGIVHRDLKPANLFLTQRVDGRPLVKVLDFGISKIQGTGPQDTKLTSTTAVIGSPSYMSPEQLRASRDVDHRGDIWALGVILFELLTGTLPFEAMNVMELCMRVASDPVPRVESRNPEIPQSLGDVVARCLEKDPNRRYQSVAELVTALEPYQAIEMSSTGERIRRVSSGGSLPPPGSSSGMMFSDRSSARVVVHGGTSVSWGKTEIGTIPPPKPTSAGLVIGGVLSALLVLGVFAGGGLYLVKHRAAAAAAAANQRDMPLPSDRTVLPPMSATSTIAADVPPQGSVTTPLPQERAPLAGTAAAASDSAKPDAPKPGSAAGPTKKTGLTGPRLQGAKPAGGGDDLLPDSRK
jgi:serine/threonine-protein kinase